MAKRMSQTDWDILHSIDPDHPDLAEEEEYLDPEDYPDDDEEEEIEENEKEEEVEDDTPTIIMVHPTPPPAPKPASPAPAQKKEPDRFSALAEAIVAVKAAIPAPAIVPVIQSILDGTDQPFAENAATRLAAETPTSALLEELLAIEPLLNKAIEGYPALVAFMTPERRAALFGKK